MILYGVGDDKLYCPQNSYVPGEQTAQAYDIAWLWKLTDYGS
jgi:hypothetical protein